MSLILNLEQSSTEMCITGGHQLLRFFEESCQAPFLCFFAMPCYAQLAVHLEICRFYRYPLMNQLQTWTKQLKQLGSVGNQHLKVPC